MQDNLWKICTGNRLLFWAPDNAQAALHLADMLWKHPYHVMVMWEDSYNKSRQIRNVACQTEHFHQCYLCSNVFSPSGSLPRFNGVFTPPVLLSGITWQ